MNECHFQGNLTRDPEKKSVGPKNTPLVNFSIAISRKYKKQDGELVKETAFIDCEAWDTGAETIAKHFKKGDPIIVHCSAKTDTWEDAEGKNRSRIRFRVNKFDFPLGKTKRDEPAAVAANDNDDVPF